MSGVRDLIARDPNWLVRLEQEFKIKVVRDGDLVSLKYDQIESPMHTRIAQECRGMVVDVPRGKILAHPYNKFWNHGEPLAADIDWSTARVQDKLDGSLMILYWDDRHECWEVASSGHPTAGGPVNDTGMTFGDLFWRAFCQLGMRAPDAYARDLCFMFELCCDENRIVVKHEKPRLVLYGARDVETGEEMDREWLSSGGDLWNWEVVREFPISTVEDCLAAAEQLDPLHSEGFVVVDAAFNRIKIKSPRYVALHHMKGEATPRRAIELWRTGETQELLAHFPEFAPKILPIHERLEQIATAAVESVVANLNAPSRKDFAMAVKDKPWSSVAFKLYGKEPTLDEAKQVMRASTMQALERMLEAVS